MATSEDSASLSADKLLERRLDYAWKYFESAAQKRMQYLNFYFVAVGILANAYVAALNNCLLAVAASVCLFGVATSVTFVMLDRRMLAFVDRALGVLETLEREAVFPDGYLHRGPGGAAGSQLGLARIEPDLDARRGTAPRTWHSLTKVKVWTRVVVQGGAAVAFGAGALHAILRLAGVI
jgi:hypothetical protein